jgi:hypothetical protein
LIVLVRVVSPSRGGERELRGIATPPPVPIRPARFETHRQNDSDEEDEYDDGEIAGLKYHGSPPNYDTFELELCQDGVRTGPAPVQQVAEIRLPDV